MTDLNTEIKKLSSRDISLFLKLIGVFADVFEMKNFKMPPVEHLQKLLSGEGFLVFVAMLKGEVIGGLTSYTIQQYVSLLPVVYIYDLAVKREFQRQGIGKMLIAAINGYCRENGVQEVFVQADKADDYALEFYRSTGGLAGEVVHFTYPLNSER